jgi:hypothetical protein
VAIAVRRRSADRRANRRTHSRNGGETMRLMKQALNAQRSTLNAESRGDAELDVERRTLGVGRFLSELQ